jgi:hypothetical protein
MLTAMEFFDSGPRSEATEVYSRYMRIASRAATQTKIQVRRV